MDVVISNLSETPIYLQIVEQIKSGILKGTLSENDVLPSIRGLAKELKISVITTKKAYEELGARGLYHKCCGQGLLCCAAEPGADAGKPSEKGGGGA